MKLRWFKGVLLVLLLVSTQYAWAESWTQLLQRGSYQKIIAAHKGRPFIVALWSVNCSHCGKDLEIFSRLSKKYANFSLVLISTDTPDQEVAISAGLQRYKLGQGGQANVESWVYADSYIERLNYEIDSKWYGELPRTYFFDAQGHAKGVSGVLDETETERWVKSGDN
jgi:thiol-disulfide isomerase/thioredoxin